MCIPATSRISCPAGISKRVLFILPPSALSLAGGRFYFQGQVVPSQIQVREVSGELCHGCHGSHPCFSAILLWLLLWFFKTPTEPKPTSPPRLVSHDAGTRGLQSAPAPPLGLGLPHGQGCLATAIGLGTWFQEAPTSAGGHACPGWKHPGGEVGRRGGSLSHLPPGEAPPGVAPASDITKWVYVI